MPVLELDLVDLTYALLCDVLDGVERLEITRHLSRHAGQVRSSEEVAVALDLDPVTVARELHCLHAAGVLARDRDAWWFDPRCSWAPGIEIVVGLYDADRGQLLCVIERAALDRLRRRAEAGTFIVSGRRTRGRA